eukprot:SAG31_NODE_21232_length_554_cov_1.454945_1_plen_20_part_10
MRALLLDLRRHFKIRCGGMM